MKTVAYPDYIVVDKLSGKCECGKDLEHLPVKSLYHKQVFDLPEKLIEVTEYQIESKQCVCGKIHEAACEVKGVTPYVGAALWRKSDLTAFDLHVFYPGRRLPDQLKK